MEKSHFWTEELEVSVKSIGDTAIGYKWMHNKASVYFAKLHRVLNYTVLVLNPITTMLLVIQANFPDKLDNVVIIIASILSFIVTVITGISTFAEFDELSRIHQTYAARYTGVVSNIRRQLGIRSQFRENANDYVAWISKTFDDLYELSPHIRPWIIKDYAKYAQKSGLPIPGQDISSVLIVDTPSPDAKSTHSSHSSKIKEVMEEYVNTSPILEKKNSKMMEHLSPSLEMFIDNLEDNDYIEPSHTRRVQDPLKRMTVKPMPSDVHEITLNAELFDDPNMQYEINRWKSWQMQPVKSC